MKQKTADDYRLERNSLYHDLEAKSRELGTAKRGLDGHTGKSRIISET